MSYILEALKKAQAERQLGTSPTLHAPTLHATDGATQGSRARKPLLMALLAMGAVIVVLLVLVLRPARESAPTPAVAAMGEARQSPQPARPRQQATTSALASIAAPAPASPAAGLAAALPPPTTTIPTHVRATPATVADATPASVKPAASEEPVLNLRELPEPIQRSIPQVSVGGYIYSKNPSDRLLLIDKVLRHEGEEVAPGLVLEKLQPKEAVFNFKGYRYRVPY